MDKFDVGTIYRYGNGELYILKGIERINGDSTEDGWDYFSERVMFSFMNLNNSEYIKVSASLVNTLFTKLYQSGTVVDSYKLESKKYRVEVYGCDDSTSVEEELTDREYDFLKRIADNITNASEYGCMPTMNIRKVD